MDMEKILSLVWFPIFPAYFGGQKGIADFYKALSHYFAIDCLCAAENGELTAENLRVIPDLPDRKKQFFSPAVWRKIIRQFRSTSYRYVLIEFPYYGLMGYWLRRKGAVYILHTHNIESQRFRSLGKWWWRGLQLYEKWSMKQADLVLFKTVADQTYALQHFSLAEEKTHLLPYGVNAAPGKDRKECRGFLEETYHIAPDEKILLFAGTLDYGPNAEAVSAIYQQLTPLLCQHRAKFKILICGRNKLASFSYLKNLQHENVIQAGFVPDIALYFGGADVFINPVRKTFGVQTKIVDAMAMHLNVVAFEQASAGLPLYLLNKKLFLARKNRYDDFVQKILEAVHEEEPTPAIFFEDLNWNVIASNFSKRLKSIRP